MNIGEANAVNIVVRRLLNATIIDDLDLDADTREAMALLAGKANRALGAGLTAAAVGEALACVDRARSAEL